MCQMQQSADLLSLLGHPKPGFVSSTEALAPFAYAEPSDSKPGPVSGQGRCFPRRLATRWNALLNSPSTSKSSMSSGIFWYVGFSPGLCGQAPYSSFHICQMWPFPATWQECFRHGMKPSTETGSHGISRLPTWVLSLIELIIPMGARHGFGSRMWTWARSTLYVIQHPIHHHAIKMSLDWL